MPDPLHLPTLLRLMPKGAYDLSYGTLVVDDLANVATGLDEADSQASDLLAESRPQDTDALLSRWEALLSLRDRGLSDAVRRNRILAKLRLVPDMCPDTIESRAEEYSGLDFDLIEAGPFRCDDPNSLTDEPYPLVDGAFVFVLEADSADAHAIPLRRADLYTLIDAIKPAHTVGIIRLDDFFTNDSLSITDCDLLGA